MRDHDGGVPKLRRLLLLLISAALVAGCDPGDQPSPMGSAPSATGAPTATATASATGATVTPMPSSPIPGSATPASSATAAPTLPIPQATTAPVGPVASTFTIPTADLPVVRFVANRGVDEGQAALLPVEVPPREEYSIGLSGRVSLEGRGMLFYYPGETGGPGFWMRGTFIDLDIAFVAADGTIIEIGQMRAESEEVHHPDQPYLAGIEAPLGWYAQHGIEAGDRFEFLFNPDEILDLD